MLKPRSGEVRILHLQGIDKRPGWTGWNRVFTEEKNGTSLAEPVRPQMSAQKIQSFLCRAGLPTKVRNTLVQGLANFLCKGSDSKYFKLCGSGSVSTTHPSRAEKHPQTNKNKLDSVPVKVYFWTLKFELHVIFTCHEILFSF